MNHSPLPCAHCGAEAKIKVGKTVMVSCTECTASTFQLLDDKDSAINAWNRRAALAGAPVAEAAPKWRPIETAPRDGTTILLSNGSAVCQGAYIYEAPSIKDVRDMEGRHIDQIENDGFDGWMDYDGGMLPEPTHWMPLPARPTAPQNKE